MTKQNENLAFAKTNAGWIAAGSAVAVMASTALFNQFSKRRAEIATPPVGNFVVVDDTTLHYVDRGKGEAVVFLHGNGVMLQDFEVSGVLALAEPGHRVLAFDRPGFGYSNRARSTLWTPAAQADVIVEALRKIGVERAVIVGHSWGTLVALAMALDHPDMVSGLVLMSGYYYGTARPDVVPASLPAIPILGDLMAATVSPLVGRVVGPPGIKASFSPAAISEKFAGFPIGLTLRPSQVRSTAADTAMMVPAAIALSRRYNELAIPITVMAGTGDKIAWIGHHAERFADEVANVNLVTTPDQGHLFHYAVPEQVIEAIDDVIARSAHEQDDEVVKQDGRSASNDADEFA
jgi:pimeloyl-ACP methyl ester carboxylesterase